MKTIRFKTGYLSPLMLSAALLMLVSCATDFEPEIEANPMTVLNVLASPDSTLTASVTRTWVFNQESGGSYSDNDLSLPDAEVHYSVDDGPWMPMRYNANKYRYESNYKVAEGDRIRVKAYSRKYGEAEGMTEVPKTVPIDSYSYTIRKEIAYDSWVYPADGEPYHPYKVVFRYEVTFTDPEPGENYYLVSSEGYCDDPILSETEGVLDGVFNKYHYNSFFTDSSISGQKYTLHVTFELYNYGFGFNWGSPQRNINTIRLCSISKDYYLYLLSLFKKYTGLQGNLENFGVAEPRSIYSNVYPGVGIVASSAPAEIQDDVTDVLNKL